MRKYASIAAVLVVLVACGEDFDAGEFDVSGSWTGSAEVVTGTDTARYDFTFDLEQAEEDVSGSATVTAGGESVEMDVDGDWDYPSVNLTLSAPEYKAVLFDAAFDVDTLVFPPDTAQVVETMPDSLFGTLAGSGFLGATLKIGRVTAP
jgi:hypothetical protein